MAVAAVSVTSFKGDEQAQALQQMQRWHLIVSRSWMMACLTRVETTGGIGARGRRRRRQRQQVKTGRQVGALCYVVCVRALQDVGQLCGMSESEAGQMFLLTIIRCRGASKMHKPELVFFKQ